MLTMTKGDMPLGLSRLSIALLLLDVVGFTLAFNLSFRYAIAEWLGWFYLPLAGILALQLMTFYVLGLYSIAEHASRFELLIRTGFAVVVAGVMTAGLVYITESWDTERLFFRGVLPGGFVMFLVWAAAFRYAAVAWATRMARRIRWLVLTDLKPGGQLDRELVVISGFGDMTVLVDDPNKAETLPEAMRKRIAGGFDQLSILADRKWSGLIIAAQGNLPESLLERIMELRLGGLRIYDLTDFYERFLQKVPVLYLRDNWFVLSHGFDLLHHDVELKIKRLLDLMLAGVFLVLALPLMIGAAVAIKLDRRGSARGPVFYRQLRTGSNGSEFYIIKLRTMVTNAESGGAQWAAQNDNRVTRVGRYLRASRLDELPQLWNVLRGEMSFIGPRPERPDFNRELEKEIPYYDLRHLVKPGITGWAQVMYDYGASKEDAMEKLQYDIYYIKNYSLLLDLLIVLKTLRVMLGRRGR
jgi:exopolysaccharide biosynthesis polyprenyl glycosylphosphotransferase